MNIKATLQEFYEKGKIPILAYEFMISMAFWLTLATGSMRPGWPDAWRFLFWTTGISGSHQAPGWAIARVPPPGALGSPFVQLMDSLAAARGPGLR